MLRKTSLVFAMTAIALTPACAQDSGSMDRDEVEKIVREYILENPEIIEEALIALTEKDRLEQMQADKDLIAENASALYGEDNAYGIGPEDAEITIVEFFDYRCGYCKTSVDWVRALPEDYDGNVRVVFRELPIFGGISETASLAALAAGKQGKYVEMHMALMGIKQNKDLTDAKIDEVAASVGVNVKKMRADMRSQDVQKQLADSKALARKLQVEGTPNFFLGDTVVRGAGEGMVRAAIEEALAES